MKTHYVIRYGWNAANQSSMGRPRHPRNDFESGYAMLVGIVNATSEDDAITMVDASVYNGQRIDAVTSPRRVRGLTEAIRSFRRIYA